MSRIAKYFKENVTLEQVRNCPTPQGTETHRPVSHGLFVDNALTELNRLGWEVTDQAHQLDKDGNRYFGAFEVFPAFDKTLSRDEAKIIFGIRNSHDKRFPAGALYGNQVTICSNLLFGGEETFGVRHTKNILEGNRLFQMVNNAVNKLTGYVKTDNERVEGYKEASLTDSQALELSLKMVENEAITARQFLPVMKEWKNPSHNEFANRNVWRLLNGTTEALKGNLTALPERSRGVQTILDEFVLQAA